MSTTPRITSTKCRINTVVSPDDGYIVARNTYRKEINIIRKIVQQVGFIYKNIVQPLFTTDCIKFRILFLRAFLARNIMREVILKCFRVMIT